MGLESDLLARMLQRLSAVLAEVRERKSRRQFDLASKALGDAWRSVLFGLDRRFLQMMQPAQVAVLLGDVNRLRGLVQLLAGDAESLHLTGYATSAAPTSHSWTELLVTADHYPIEP